MNLEELKPEINKIVEFVKTLPERFQDKCFEILLNNLLLQTTPTIRVERQIPTLKTTLKLPVDVKAFLKRYSIQEEVMDKLFYIEGGEIRPTYEIITTTKSRAQIQIALLIALENALKTTPSKFEFSMDLVREKCVDLRCIDPPNFKANFRNNSKLFKSLEDEEHVELSNEGKEELANVISELTKL